MLWWPVLLSSKSAQTRYGKYITTYCCKEVTGSVLTIQSTNTFGVSCQKWLMWSVLRIFLSEKVAKPILQVTVSSMQTGYAFFLGLQIGIRGPASLLSEARNVSTIGGCLKTPLQTATTNFNHRSVKEY
jgi:hypothetical protein